MLAKDTENSFHTYRVTLLEATTLREFGPVCSHYSDNHFACVQLAYMSLVGSRLTAKNRFVCTLLLHKMCDFSGMINASQIWARDHVVYPC
jgi:hypothetical protein